MLDLKRIRENPGAVKAGAAAKGAACDIDGIIRLDDQRRAYLTEAEAAKGLRNQCSKEIGARRKSGEDTSAVQEEVRELGVKIKDLDAKAKDLTVERDRLLEWVPNPPAEGVPQGRGEEDNVEVRAWGVKPSFDFEPKPHWEIGAELGIIDLDRASKLAGAHWVLFRGAGARLERALWSFMLDLHTSEHGYEEVLPPYLVSRECMFGTGQLPKLEEDMYRLAEDDLFLIPTAEVPVTNLHRGETIPGAMLPVRYCAYTACFRREAGAYGRQTRGMARIHQFDKVELVRFTTPERSYEELELLVTHAEEVLRRLGLHYRVVELCTGELSFAAAKCYDIEVWAPGVGRYLEVSSCSNFEDFQARRAGIRYRDPKTNSLGYCHTLNGSGVALPRVFIAVVEAFQEKDGSVRVPEVLRPYMGGVERISTPAGGPAAPARQGGDSK